MYARMVVPLDGSGFGDHAIAAAAAIARRAGAEIELVHVHQTPHDDHYLGDITAYQFQGEYHRPAELNSAHLENERAGLRLRAEGMAEEHGVRARYRLLEGLVHDALQREIEQLGADLVVMATHARHGISRWRYGSIGDAVMRHSSVPTVLVRPTAEPATRERRFRRILVALDGSAFSEEIVPAALQMAVVMDADVTLLHVLPRSSAAVRSAGWLPESFDDSDAYLEALADRYSSVAYLSTRTVVADRPSTAIAQLAHSEGHDLIALATHGRGGLTRMLVGSTADEVLGLTFTPVLAVRPKPVPSDPIPEELVGMYNAGFAG
jgi:nucleotide-binding universal stress UspA family protein